MLSIEVDIPRMGHGVPPGGTVGCLARFGSDSPWIVHRAQLILMWRLQHDLWHEEQEVMVIPLAAHGEEMPPLAKRSFSLIVPAYPRSFQGRHIRLMWQLVTDVRARTGERLMDRFPLWFGYGEGERL